MSISDEILRIELVYRNGGRPDGVRVPKTISLSEVINDRISELYDGKVSAIIEQSLIHTLRRDGHLPPALGPQGAEPHDFDNNLEWVERQAKKQTDKSKTIKKK